jgi:hypothetical protein
MNFFTFHSTSGWKPSGRLTPRIAGAILVQFWPLSSLPSYSLNDIIIETLQVQGSLSKIYPLPISLCHPCNCYKYDKYDMGHTHRTNYKRRNEEEGVLCGWKSFTAIFDVICIMAVSSGCWAADDYESHYNGRTMVALRPWHGHITANTYLSIFVKTLSVWHFSLL